MKTIGLIGGMSWESTANYYQALNTGIKNHLGGLHSAKILMYSVDFDEIERFQRAGDWAGAAQQLGEYAQRLEQAGADFILIGTNTMHKVEPEISAMISIPVLHIADATAESIKMDGHRTVALLGTRFTMEQAFYRQRLESHDLQVLTPDTDDRAIIHRIIYEELCRGEIRDDSRQQALEVINRMRSRGIEAVVLGCTELPMLLTPEFTNLPLYDTAVLHAQAAVKLALS